MAAQPVNQNDTGTRVSKRLKLPNLRADVTGADPRTEVSTIGHSPGESTFFLPGDTVFCLPYALSESLSSSLFPPS
jgi:hypothetical protein